MISSILIIGIWIFVGVLSYSFFSTAKKNHYRFRSLYTIASLNIFQAILGVYFLITGNGMFQEARWIAFTLIEVQFLNFVLRDTQNRHIQLLIQTFFYFVLLSSTVIYSLGLNFLIALTLVLVAYTSPMEIIKKHFTWSFVLYFLTALAPNIFGFTTAASLVMGVLFSAHFAWGVLKIYKAEKINDEIENNIREGIKKDLERKEK